MTTDNWIQLIGTILTFVALAISIIAVRKQIKKDNAELLEKAVQAALEDQSKWTETNSQVQLLKQRVKALEDSDKVDAEIVQRIFDKLDNITKQVQEGLSKHVVDFHTNRKNDG